MLKPSGRIVIADFVRKQDRIGQATRFHAGGSSLPELITPVTDAGFLHPETIELRPVRLSAFPGAAILIAHNR